MIDQALMTVVTVVVMATSSGDDAPLWILAAGPAGGAATYWALHRYYRNTDKSHAYERETTVKAEPVTGSDEKIDEVRGTQKTRIAGDNVREYRTRVTRIQGETNAK